MAEAQIEILFQLYEDETRLRQKFLCYKFAEEAISTLPACIIHPKMLKTHIDEKKKECEQLRNSMNTLRGKITKLYSSYAPHDVTDEEIFLDANYSEELLDCANSLQNQSGLFDENDVAVNPKNGDWFQKYKTILKNLYVKQLTGNNIKRKQELEELKSQFEKKIHECEDLKNQLNVANGNLSMLTSKFHLALESLKMEKLQREDVERERDLYEYSTEELNRLLGKYQNHVCPQTSINDTKPIEQSMIGGNNQIETNSEIEYDDNFLIFIRNLQDKLMNAGNNQKLFSGDQKHHQTTSNEETSSSLGDQEYLEANDETSYESTSESSNFTTLDLSGSDFVSDIDASDIEIDHSDLIQKSDDVEPPMVDFELATVDNQTVGVPETFAMTPMSTPLKSNGSSVALDISSESIQKSTSSADGPSKTISTSQLLHCKKCGISLFMANKTEQAKQTKCPMCNVSYNAPNEKKDFEKLSKKKYYDRKSHEEVSYECAHCGILRKSKSGLKNHIRSQHFSEESREFKCAFCDKSFGTRYHLKIHKLLLAHSHSSDGFFKCSMCDANFKHPSHKKHHEWVHHGIGDRFSCVYCKKEYRIESNLTQHLQKHHSR